ncbi:MAG: hypothetical protein QG661_3227 [Actinomycetota bacterium]|jgi:hypothetical protein|nr:hypothetical protein [Actinomycetota bacterium]
MWHYAPMFARKPEPTIRELDHLAEHVLRKVRNREGVVWPGIPSVHRKLVDDMGGTRWWVEMMADLDTAKGELGW